MWRVWEKFKALKVGKAFWNLFQFYQNLLIHGAQELTKYIIFLPRGTFSNSLSKRTSICIRYNFHGIFKILKMANNIFYCVEILWFFCIISTLIKAFCIYILIILAFMKEIEFSKINFKTDFIICSLHLRNKIFLFNVVK